MKMAYNIALEGKYGDKIKKIFTKKKDEELDCFKL